MQNINYQETIVIPALQKKLQEMTNANLVLEISLMVEQTKNKDLQQYYSSKLNNTTLEDELKAKEQRIATLKNEYKTLADERDNIKTQLSRETSLKESILTEYNILKSKIQSLDSQIATLNSENSNLKSEVQSLQKKPRKKQEPLVEVLDGETY